MTRAAESARAYRLRRKLATRGLAPDELDFLTRYDAGKGRAGRPVVNGAPVATHAEEHTNGRNRPAGVWRDGVDIDAPSRSYDPPAAAPAVLDVPPPVADRPRHTLTDFTDPADLAPTVDVDAAPDASAGCGLCSACRGAAPAPTCPVSGSVIPRPITPEQALGMAQAAFVALRLSVASAYGFNLPSPPASAQVRAAGDSLSQLSHRYDLQAIADFAPFVTLVQAFGGYAISAGKESKAMRDAARAT